MQSESPQTRATFKKWIPLVSICMGTFMLLVDTTIVQVALPAIGTGLDASFTSLQWVVDGYVVALAALLLTVGALADRLGHRRFYVGGLIMFAAASALCGAAPNDESLVAFRFIQGIAAAALLTTTMALINTTYQGRDRGKAFGAWAAVASAASALGPIVGGLLVDVLTWRWIFFVNLPICAVAVGLAWTSLAADRPTTKKRIDLIGLLTFTVASVSLMYVLIEASSDGWGSTISIALMLVSAAGFAAFVAAEWNCPYAMIDLTIFRSRAFNGLMLAALLVNFVAFAPATFTSIWLQGVEGLSATQVGLTQLPLAGMAFVVSWQTGRYLHRVVPGLAIAAGLAFIALGSFCNAVLLQGDSTWPSLLAGFALIGIGTGLAVPSFTAAVMGSVPAEKGGMASGTLNTARQLGFAIGIAVFAIAFAGGARTSLTNAGTSDPIGAADALTSGQAGAHIANSASDAGLQSAFHVASLAGLDRVFVLAGLLAVIASIAVAILTRTPRPPAPEAATPDPVTTDEGETHV